MTNKLAEALYVHTPSDLGDSATMSFDGPAKLNWRTSTRIGFHYHWLREVTGSVLDADFGLKINTPASANLQLSVKGCFRTVISINNDDGWLRVRLLKSCGADESPGLQVGVSAELSSPGPEAPDSLSSALLGDTDTRESALNDGPHPVMALRDDIYKAAPTAMGKLISAKLSWQYSTATDETPLFEGLFAFTDEGLALYRRVLRGDVISVDDAIGEHSKVLQGAFSGAVSGETTVELHLPFLDKKQWRSRQDLLASMEVEATDDGRILVSLPDGRTRSELTNSYQSLLAIAGSLNYGDSGANDNFTLGFTDQRTLAPLQASQALAPLLESYGFSPSVGEWLANLPQDRGQLDVRFSLSIPGSLVSAWLEIPEERSLAFYHALSAVSTAVQKSLRTWLPYVYFSDLDNYDAQELAYSLLVYQAGKPFSRKTRSDFTYDVLNSDSVALAFRYAGRRLPEIVRSVQQLLLASGKTQTAQNYTGKQSRRIISSVKRGYRYFHSLLAADAYFMGELINLGHRGRKLGTDLQESPATATSKLARYVRDFVKALHTKLRRFYGGQELFHFASLMLIEATRALSSAFKETPKVEAVLRVRLPGDTEAEEHVFINDGYRPRA